jgi:hypothetical protein
MSVYIEGDKSQFLSKNKVLALKTFLKNEAQKENFDVKKLQLNDKDYLKSGSLKISFTKPDFKVVLLTEEQTKRELLLRKIKSKSRGHILKERRKMEEVLEKEKNTIGKSLFKKYEKVLRMNGGELPLPSQMLENKDDMSRLMELMKNPILFNELKSNPAIKSYYDGLVNNMENVSQSNIHSVQNDNDTEEED